MDELRAVVRFAADCAQELLPDFEAVAPDDSRPREAIDAARMFADGAPRSALQRTAAFAAHRAAKSVSEETAQLAALACGDAAAAAYLHPIAKASQVGHILRAAACAARVAELKTGVTDSGGIRNVAERATSPVPEILRRYPSPPSGTSRVAQLMSELDATIRTRHEEPNPTPLTAFSVRDGRLDGFQPRAQNRSVSSDCENLQPRMLPLASSRDE